MQRRGRVFRAPLKRLERLELRRQPSRKSRADPSKKEAPTLVIRQNQAVGIAFGKPSRDRSACAWIPFACTEPRIAGIVIAGPRLSESLVRQFPLAIGLRSHTAPIPSVGHPPPSSTGIDATPRLIALSPFLSQIDFDPLHLSQKPKRHPVVARTPQNPSAQRAIAVEPSADDGHYAESIFAMRANRRRHLCRRKVRKDRVGNLPFARRTALPCFFEHKAKSPPCNSVRRSSQNEQNPQQAPPASAMPRINGGQDGMQTDLSHERDRSSEPMPYHHPRRRRTEETVYE